MTTLSKEEAKDIVKKILPGVKLRLKPEIAGKPYPKTVIRVVDILSGVHPALEREGITSDVFCKIAEAMHEQGIATDIDAFFYNYRVSFVFSPAGKGYKKPSPEICKARLNRAKRIEIYHELKYKQK